MSEVSKQVHDFRVATISQIVGSLWKLQEKGRKMIPNFEKVKWLSSIYDSNMLQLCFVSLIILVPSNSKCIVRGVAVSSLTIELSFSCCPESPDNKYVLSVLTWVCRIPPRSSNLRTTPQPFSCLKYSNLLHSTGPNILG